MSQAAALLVPGDLVAEVAGKHPALRNHSCNAFPGNTPGLQVLVHSLFPAHGKVLHLLLLPGGRQSLLAPAVKKHAGIRQPAAELLHPPLGVRPGLVHLVDKEDRWDPIAFQQLPQGLHMALDAICPADHQHGIVQHLQGALHLCRKVHMARRVQKRHRQAGQIRGFWQHKFSLLGKNGDPSLPLQCIGVQKGIPIVHTARPADSSA